jgi:hypothetical protein
MLPLIGLAGLAGGGGGGGGLLTALGIGGAAAGGGALGGLFGGGGSSGGYSGPGSRVRLASGLASGIPNALGAIYNLGQTARLQKMFDQYMNPERFARSGWAPGAIAANQVDTGLDDFLTRYKAQAAGPFEKGGMYANAPAYVKQGIKGLSAKDIWS